MAGIVQQQKECRNGATANVLTKKHGREGYPGHTFCQREETFATRSNGLRARRKSAAADSSPKISDKPDCARRRK